jgi:nitrogen-specific signal transduction histidine kinase
MALLRMGLDAIANAIGRQLMEQERERLETRLQQARRLETVGALANDVAHNFNNIVGAILGYTEMAEDAAAPSASHPFVTEIRRAAERARELIDQILAFARPHTAPQVAVDISALLAETLPLLRASLLPAVKLDVGPVPSALMVWGAQASLQQVILNLCRNGAQAMEQGGRISVQVTTDTVDAACALSHGMLSPGRYVCLSVADTGPGIERPAFERIFEPFYTTRAKGSGLGLATVKDIVRDYGGAINVESRAGAGTRFDIWLPLADTLAGNGRNAVSDPPLPRGRGETILLVEKGASDLLRDEELLAALGYEPAGFNNVQEAVRACQAAPRRFDAAIVGYDDRPVTALDLAASIRAAAPELPILLAVASATEIRADALLTAGVADLLSLPLQASAVATALHAVCQGRVRVEV